MKKTGLNGYFYEFSVDYNDFSTINLDKAIPFVHKYLMAKYNIKCLYLLRKYFILDPYFCQI